MARRVPTVTAAVLAALGACALVLPATAATAPTSVQLPVYPSDFSTTNFSTAAFDGYGAEFSALPAAGTKFTLDIENKPQATWAHTSEGLRLNGVDPLATAAKVRFMYYVGSGGFPAVDSAETTVADLFSTGGWRVQYPVEGDGVAGIDFSAQALIGGQYHKVGGFVQCVPVSTPRSTTAFTTQSLASCRWAVNSRMVETTPGNFTYQAGQYVFDGTTDRTTSDFLDQFGDYEVVAFGPNVGRFAPLSATVVVQSLRAFGTSFAFVEELEPDATPPAPDTTALTELLESEEVTAQAAEYDPDSESVDIQSDWTAFDGWVDAWGYSSPTYLGVAPVSFGQVDLGILDVSGLASGPHTIVLIGQSSGSIQAFSIVIPAAPTPTPTDTPTPSPTPSATATPTPTPSPSATSTPTPTPTPSATSTPSATPSPGGLAATGSSMGELVAVAGIALLGGAGAVLAATWRRRRKA
jgi:hypothetical protein